MHLENPNKSLRNQLADYDSPLDLDAGWEQLQRARRKRRRRGPLGWWVAGVALLLLLGTAGGFYALRGPAPVAADDPVSSIPADPRSTVPAARASVAGTTTTPIAPVSSRTPGGTFSPFSGQIEGDKAQQSTRVPPAAPSAPSPARPGEFGTGKPLPPPTAASFSPQPTRDVSPELPLIPPRPSRRFLARNLNNESPNQPNPESTDTAIPVLPKGDLTSLPFAPALDPFNRPSTLKAPPLQPPRSRVRWWVGPVLAYGRSYRRAGAGPSPLASWRTATEQALDSRRGGFHLTREHPGGFSVGATLGYQRSVDRIDFERLRVDSVRENRVVTLIERLDGTTTSISGDTTLARTVRARRLHYLRYSQVFLQLSAGHRLPLGPRWSLRVEGGAQLGLAQWAGGTTFADATDWSQRQTLGELDYRRSGGVDLVAGLGLGYSLGRRWRSSWLLRGQYGLSDWGTGSDGQSIHRHALLGEWRIGYCWR